MKKIICLLFMMLTATGVLFGCSTKDNGQSGAEGSEQILTKEIDWYDFSAYEKRGRIKNIEELDLSADSEVYTFTYSSGRYGIKGFIAIPKTCLKNRIPYNCIVYNRGGNSNIGLLTGEEIAAMCDATGRVVVASQYRGADSTYGVDEFGGADVEDVTALVDLCENEFRFVDMQNLCMAGVSRGGMMSYIAARYDKRVKGIVAVSAVTDLVASYNDREDMREILRNAIGGSPEEFPEEYEKRSAICWAEEIEAPVFIIHNRDDQMVSFAQAEAMNEKLKGSKFGCSMMVHQDSVHGLHTDDINNIVEWIDQALPKTQEK